jgi:hypothetical protein
MQTAPVDEWTILFEYYTPSALMANSGLGA